MVLLQSYLLTQEPTCQYYNNLEPYAEMNVPATVAQKERDIRIFLQQLL